MTIDILQLILCEVARLHDVPMVKGLTVSFFVWTQLEHQIVMFDKHGVRLTAVTGEELELPLLEGLASVAYVPIKFPRYIFLWGNLLAAEIFIAKVGRDLFEKSLRYAFQFGRDIVCDASVLRWNKTLNGHSVESKAP